MDDACLFGDPQAVYQAKRDISSLFSTKDVGELKEYVGVTVDKSNNTIGLSQPDIITRLERYFGSEVEKMREYKAPLAAHHHVVRPEGGTSTLSREDMLKYRSGTGSLLYLVKHSRPDIGNAVQELSKVMDSATTGHMKDLLCCIRYVLLTRNKKLKYQLNATDGIYIVAICDSDYAGDPQSRKSISGYIVYINGCPIAWRSRQ